LDKLHSVIIQVYYLYMKISISKQPGIQLVDFINH